MRWETASRAKGASEVAAQWATRGEGKVVLVGGAGFDPRGPTGYECIAASCPKPVDLIQIRMEPIPTDSSTKVLAAEARTRIEDVAQVSGASITDVGVEHAGASSTALLIARAFFEADAIRPYDEVVVDVSALPRTVFFPLIRGILLMIDGGQWVGEFHVIACDNPGIDALVTGEGAEAPATLPGFGARSPRGEGGTPIWVPVLGEGETTRVAALHDDITAKEVCPVLPFPSANPRRGDDLVREYRGLLFERIGVEPRNFIYADESNPFDLYRSLCRLDERYAGALKPLGDTRMILSAHSSKLLSLGVLLAAYERDLEVRHVSPSIYGLEDRQAVDALAQDNLLVDLWLAGEPYAQD